MLGRRCWPRVQALLTSGVHTICSNDVAFSAIKTDGMVVGWSLAVSVPAPGVLMVEGSLRERSASCAGSTLVEGYAADAKLQRHSTWCESHSS
jgi:hypothetical protein